MNIKMAWKFQILLKWLIFGQKLVIMLSDGNGLDIYYYYYLAVKCRIIILFEQKK